MNLKPKRPPRGMLARIRRLRTRGPLAPASLVRGLFCSTVVLGFMLPACGSDDSSSEAGTQPSADASPPQDGSACTPTTCAEAGAECGIIDDGCGGTLNCGACSNAGPCGATINDGSVLPLIEPRGFTLADIPVVELAAMPEPSASTVGKTYYLDAAQGSDTTGDGTAGNPFQSVQHVWPLLEGGDTVKLNGGNYGSIKYCPWTCNGDPEEIGSGEGSLFDDWVTIEPVEGASPELEHISIVMRSDTEERPDMFLKLKGLVIRDGIELRGGNNVAVMDSSVTTQAQLVAGDPRIDDIVGISLRDADNVLIQGNDVFDTSLGIATNNHTNITIKGNHIHDLLHDGIRLTSSSNALVEGNVIHGLDDGFDDDEADGVNTVSRHCDALHIFQSGASCDALRIVENIIVRSNIFYDAEAQHVQINNYGSCDMWNRNFVFENNVFGPSVANPFNAADPVDGLVFRHNTFLPITGRVFSSPWRDLPMDNHTFRISSNYKRVAVYNNILSNALALDDGQILNDWNLNWSKAGVDPAIAQNSIYDPDIQFEDLDSFDAIVAPDSKSIDFGTSKFALTDLCDDLYGTPRDTRPDVGAYEEPGHDPAPEANLPTEPANPTTFFDDFEDANYLKDIYLNTDVQTGLSWFESDRNTGSFRIMSSEGNNRLVGPSAAGEDFIFSEQGANWKRYVVSLVAGNGYVDVGSGVLLLVRDEDNHYFVDISRDTGLLMRVLGGTRTQLAESAELRLPHSGLKDYALSVAAGDSGIEFRLDGGADGVDNVVFTDTDAAAISTFVSGGIGFYRKLDRDYHAVSVDDVKVVVSEVEP